MLGYPWLIICRSLPGLLVIWPLGFHSVWLYLDAHFQLIRLSVLTTHDRAHYSLTCFLHLIDRIPVIATTVMMRFVQITVLRAAVTFLTWGPANLQDLLALPLHLINLLGFIHSSLEDNLYFIGEPYLQR